MKKIILLLALLFSANAYGQIIHTIAGNGFAGYTGDGIPATASSLHTPYGICVDAAGNIYIPDGGNRRVRKISPAGTISTIAGTGVLGYSGDGGPATAAQLFEPTCVFVDAANNVFIADEYNNCVRKINPAGIITTLAGTGTSGYTGDGGPATAARLYYPYSITADALGNVYIADRGNHCIRKINTAGIISTFAGTGTSGYSGDGGPATAARFFQPVSLCLSTSGDMYITDWGNRRVRKINPAGVISTIAGDGTFSFADGVPAVSTGLSNPYGVSIDCNGNIYVGEYTGYRIRRINAAGIIHTIAGNGTFGYTGDGGPATAAQLYYPIALSLDAAGDMLVSDQGNNCIRKITNPGTGTTISGPSVICVGGTGSYTAAVAGGTWGSITGRASISGAGVATGVSSGVDTITYTGCSSLSRFPVTVSTTPTVASISGPDTVCAGATITLINPTTGGMWTSSAAGIATVASGTGTVTGISAGVSAITYTLTTSCGTATTSRTVTVIPLPTVAPISGPNVICDDNGIDLTNPTPGGVWSSTNTSIAVVSATGHVNGFPYGVDTIMYTVSNGCGTAAALHTVTVMTLPAISPISGPNTVCRDSTITLTDTTSGGTWSSTFTSITTVGATGIVTGITAGTDTIRYSKTNACGTASAFKVIRVLNCDSILSAPPGYQLPDDVAIVPNPAKGSFLITGNIDTPPGSETEIEILELRGRCVYKSKFIAPDGRITHMVATEKALPGGLYVVVVKTAVACKVKRLLIQE